MSLTLTKTASAMAASADDHRDQRLGPVEALVGRVPPGPWPAGVEQADRDLVGDHQRPEHQNDRSDDDDGRRTDAEFALQVGPVKAVKRRRPRPEADQEQREGNAAVNLRVRHAIGIHRDRGRAADRPVEVDQQVRKHRNRRQNQERRGKHQQIAGQPLLGPPPRVLDRDRHRGPGVCPAACGPKPRTAPEPRSRAAAAPDRPSRCSRRARSDGRPGARERAAPSPPAAAPRSATAPPSHRNDAPAPTSSTATRRPAQQPAPPRRAPPPRRAARRSGGGRPQQRRPTAASSATGLSRRGRRRPSAAPSRMPPSTIQMKRLSSTDRATT